MGGDSADGLRGGNTSLTDRRTVSIDEVRSLARHALGAIAVGDSVGSELFTEDVRGDSSDMRVRSRTELEYQLEDRAGGLSNVEFALDRVEQVSTGWRAQWRMSGEHTGDVLFNEELYFAATGRRISLSAVTHFALRSCRIRAFRTTYEGADLVDQLRTDSG
jgi:hypothetical protein